MNTSRSELLTLHPRSQNDTLSSNPTRNRGRLLTATQVADRIGAVSPEWVRRNAPGKLDLGHSTKRWFEADIEEWLASTKEGLSYP